MAKKTKRRNRTPHTGVKVKRISRQSGTAYVARWSDPETGKECQLAFSKLKPAITTREGREAWAIDKAKDLAKRRAAIASGVVVSSKTKLSEAIENYFLTAAAEGLKKATLTGYADGTKPLALWCRKHGVQHTEEITGAKLEAFRKYFIGLKAKTPAKGKGVGKGVWEAGTKPRSPYTINNGLSAVRTILNQWRREGLLPQMTSDDISDHLRRVKVQKNTPHFLRSSEIVAVLKAAQRHDDASYTFARRGTTSTTGEYQYTPVYEFLIAVLLTGCRFAEIAGLRWDEVNLEAGEILLQGDRTKTGHGRRIALDVSPTLKTMLERLQIQKGASRFVFSDRAGRDVKRQKGNQNKDAGMDRNAADRARKRLIAKFGAPEFTWHDLRRTCGTFLACAPGMYAGAGAFHAAKRLGHSVVVSERHYAGAVTDIPKDAATLEAAMGIESELKPAGQSDGAKGVV
ncbi:tyrosine-type recombinase/integrase [Planctomycetota bacterium]|nr:tyrosine-type recombinase/integrase [Planctomycetota bacterium]